MSSIIITWHGHSCFTLEFDGWHMVIDPYQDGTIPGMSNLQLDAEGVLCSHNHFDHNYTQAVTLNHDAPPCPFKIETFSCPHDTCNGDLRGMSTVHILSAGGMRVAHMGDICCEALPDDSIATLKGVDLLIVPVGGCYTIDAVTAKNYVDLISPKIVIPMHYRGEGFGFREINTLDEFLPLFPNAKVLNTNVIELTPETGPAVIIPRL